MASVPGYGRRLRLHDSQQAKSRGKTIAGPMYANGHDRVADSAEKLKKARFIKVPLISDPSTVRKKATRIRFKIKNFNASKVAILAKPA